MKLTRLLYSHDEVKYSIVCSLLEKLDQDICYYWCGELYYSDTEDTYDIFEFIWKIYFDFYAIHNPGLEKYIQKKEIIWKECPDLKILLYVIENLWHSVSSYEVFTLRNIVKSNPHNLILYRTNKKKWKWLIDFPRRYHTFLISIDKGDKENVARQLYHLCQKNETVEIYRVIIRYYSTKVELLPEKIIEKKWDNRHWRDDYQGLLALTIHLTIPIEEINHPFIFKQPSRNSIDIVENDHKNIEKRHSDCDRVYNILKDYRKYTIHQLIGVFTLDRDSIENFVHECRENWKHYAYKTPVWKKRMLAYGISNSTKKLVIENECGFNEKYNLELDEQSLEVQNRSLCNIANYTINEWLEDIFKSSHHPNLDSLCSY